MPSPDYKKGESVSEYVSRCMGSGPIVKDFPDNEQRAAYCYSEYRRKKKEANK